MTGSTVRLTMAQALVRYLLASSTIIDGKKAPLFPGVFAIFGHGNVTCLSEALEAVKDELPTWRGQNEQSMALAAIGFAKADAPAPDHGRGDVDRPRPAQHGHGRRHWPSPTGCRSCCWPATPSSNRRPDPVLQQVEQFGDPTDHGQRRFKAVVALLGPHHPSRADHLVAAAGGRRDARPGRLRPGLHRPAAGYSGDRGRLSRGLLRPRRSTRCRGRGPTRTGSRRRSSSSRPPSVRCSSPAAACAIRSPRRRWRSFAEKHGIPLCRDHRGQELGQPRPPGPCRAARDHRVVLGQRTRGRGRRDPRHRHAAAGLHHGVLDGLRAGRAIRLDQHGALGCGEAPGAAVVGDARETVAELEAALGGWQADSGWMDKGRRAFAKWNATARRPAEAHQRSGPDLCPGGRRRERQGGRPRST